MLLSLSFAELLVGLFFFLALPQRLRGRELVLKEFEVVQLALGPHAGAPAIALLGERDATIPTGKAGALLRTLLAPWGRMMLYKRQSLPVAWYGQLGKGPCCKATVY